VLEPGFARDLGQALSVLLRLRLGEQLEALRRGETASDRVRTGALGRLDRDLLRDALRVVETFKHWLATRFKLE
jgi:CBS domain-containing protein